MTLLEGSCERSNGMHTTEYFTEIQHALNNGILPEENGNWVLPMQGNELRKISLSNLTARKIRDKYWQVV